MNQPKKVYTTLKIYTLLYFYYVNFNNNTFSKDIKSYSILIRNSKMEEKTNAIFDINCLKGENNNNVTHCKESTLHRFHIILTLLLVKLTLFFGGGVLVLLVFGYEIVHVTFRLREFHLIHTLT